LLVSFAGPFKKGRMSILFYAYGIIALLMILSVLAITVKTDDIIDNKRK
jgi:hypothetical protein